MNDIRRLTLGGELCGASGELTASCGDDEGRGILGDIIGLGGVCIGEFGSTNPSVVSEGLPAFLGVSCSQPSLLSFLVCLISSGIGGTTGVFAVASGILWPIFLRFFRFLRVIRPVPSTLTPYWSC